MPAAEATKADDASDDKRRTPRPPFLTGRMAWIHWTSVRSVLVMVETHSLSSSSNFRSARQLNGAARNVMLQLWCTE